PRGRLPAFEAEPAVDRRLRDECEVLDDRQLRRGAAGRDLGLKKRILNSVARNAGLARYARADVAFEAVGVALRVVRCDRTQRVIEQRDVLAAVAVALPDAASVQRAVFGELADEKIDSLIVAARRRREKDEHMLAADVLGRAVNLRDAIVELPADLGDGNHSR